ncbi:hypothetical protein MJO29_003310 [Puccinia striiformis f. sp. tritici]|nr:hypothetical protein MJO29_003310 [Puccinia striiformis f. sp. tritici]
MKTTTRPDTVSRAVYAIERAMLPSPVRSTVTGAEDESEEQYFSVPQSVTIEASVHTGLITAVHPGIVPQTSYGDETEYHHIPQRYLVFPGLVDPHVHLNEPGRTDWEGFETGTDVCTNLPLFLILNSFMTSFEPWYLTGCRCRRNNYTCRYASQCHPSNNNTS